MNWKRWGVENPQVGVEFIIRDWYDGWNYNIMYISTKDDLVWHSNCQFCDKEKYTPVTQDSMDGVEWSSLE